MIFEGAQGLGKSSAFAALASAPWFADTLPDLSSKDAALYLQGKWIVEFGELDAMTRSEVTTVKGFLTRQIDQVRPPYGSRWVDFLRQTVFAGTTNGKDYLMDTTGGRRWWPVIVQRILLDELHRDRDQIWAEAVAAFKSGEKWWIDDNYLSNIILEQQEARLSLDPWDDTVFAWLMQTSVSSATSETIFDRCLRLDMSKVSKRESNRLGAVMRRIKWEKSKVRIGGVPRWTWSPSDEWQAFINAQNAHSAGRVGTSSSSLS